MILGSREESSLPKSLLSSSVSTYVAVISTPGNKAPVGSVTEPLIWAVACPQTLVEPRSLSGIGSLEARINNLRAIPGL